MAHERYSVSIWHGESGSLAYVVDSQDPDDCLGIYSTIKYGADFRRRAQSEADRLNKQLQASQ